MAIAFAHNAFNLRLVSAELTLYTLYNSSSLGGPITINFTFRDDILEILIFYRSTYPIEGIYINSIRDLLANLISF